MAWYQALDAGLSRGRQMFQEDPRRHMREDMLMARTQQEWAQQDEDRAARAKAEGFKQLGGAFSTIAFDADGRQRTPDEIFNDEVSRQQVTQLSNAPVLQELREQLGIGKIDGYQRGDDGQWYAVADGKRTPYAFADLQNAYAAEMAKYDSQFNQARTNAAGYSTRAGLLDGMRPQERQNPVAGAAPADLAPAAGVPTAAPSAEPEDPWLAAAQIPPEERVSPAMYEAQRVQSLIRAEQNYKGLKRELTRLDGLRFRGKAPEDYDERRAELVDLLRLARSEQEQIRAELEAQGTSGARIAGQKAQVASQRALDGLRTAARYHPVNYTIPGLAYHYGVPALGEMKRAVSEFFEGMMGTPEQVQRTEQQVAAVVGEQTGPAQPAQQPPGQPPRGLGMAAGAQPAPERSRPSFAQVRRAYAAGEISLDQARELLYGPATSTKVHSIGDGRAIIQRGNDLQMIGGDGAGGYDLKDGKRVVDYADALADVMVGGREFEDNADRDRAKALASRMVMSTARDAQALWPQLTTENAVAGMQDAYDWQLQAKALADDGFLWMKNEDLGGFNSLVVGMAALQNGVTPDEFVNVLVNRIGDLSQISPRLAARLTQAYGRARRDYQMSPDEAVAAALEAVPEVAGATR